MIKLNYIVDSKIKDICNILISSECPNNAREIGCLSCTGRSGMGIYDRSFPWFNVGDRLLLKIL